MINPSQNTGVIEVAPKSTDWFSSGETGIASAVRLVSGDWRPYLPPGEWQKDMPVGIDGFETDACVSFSANDFLETLGDWYIKNNIAPFTPENVQWLKDNGYFNPDGTLNFSDRFTAKISGTTTNGNSLPAVWDSIHKNGLVPESAWPMPLSELKADTNNNGQTTANWNIYYAAVPDSVVQLGLQFKARFTVNYEWVFSPSSPATNASIAEALKIAPLQIATAVCWPWNTSDIIKGCGAGTQHATLLSCIDTTAMYDLDHYVPFQKRLGLDYNITYAMRGTFNVPTQVTPPATFHYTFTKSLYYGDPKNDLVELTNLQAALQFLNYMKPGVFGPFGPQTRTALALFEKAHGIVDPQPGENFGPLNRIAINALLK